MSFSIRENEKIIKVFRAHKGNLHASIFFAVLILAVLFFLRWQLGFDLGGYWPHLMGIVFLIFLVWLLLKWHLWRSYRLIVTDERVIYINQKGIFNKVVSDFLFQDIYEVGYEKKGIGAAISNYGTINIKTGSKDEEGTEIEKIPRPQDVVELINRVRQN